MKRSYEQREDIYTLIIGSSKVITHIVFLQITADGTDVKTNTHLHIHIEVSDSGLMKVQI